MFSVYANKVYQMMLYGSSRSRCRRVYVGMDGSIAKEVNRIEGVEQGPRCLIDLPFLLVYFQGSGGGRDTSSLDLIPFRFRLL